MTARTWQLCQDIQDRTAITGQIDSAVRIRRAGTGELGDKSADTGSQERTAGTTRWIGQSGHDNRGRIAMAGKFDRMIRKRQDRLAGTGQPWQNSQTGKSGQDSWDKKIMAGQP
jgi:hypothetical protein